MDQDARFFASYILAGSIWAGYSNLDESDDTKPFQYEPDEIIEIGKETGWRGRDVGDWGHPRGQQMLEFVASPTSPRQTAGSRQDAQGR